MTTTPHTTPAALAIECRDYATSLRGAFRVAQLNGGAPASFLRVADIMERASVALAASAPVAPTQQGEYLPLPQPDTHCYDEDRQVDVWSYSASTLLAYVDADRAARGAAQAAPAPVAEDADPLQDAANWLVTSRATTSATELGGRLCIGYNRADRLFNAARAQAAQPEGGAKL